MIKIFFFIILLIILYVIIYCFLTKDYIDDTNKKYDINEDGFTTFKEVVAEDDIKILLEKSQQKDYKYIKNFIVQNKKIKKIYKTLLGKNYQFQDYIFVIKRSSIHTCHRDGNGHFFNKDQTNPSYTIIIYLEDMEKSLGVIPKSHQTVDSFGLNITNKLINLPCKKGDIIIFNANLLHVGTINEKDDHFRIQMKLTHKDDISAISFYENYNKILDEENKLPKIIRIFQRNLSCMIPFLSNIGQNVIQTTTQDKNDNIIKKLYSYLCYGNGEAFDLPNLLV